MLPRTSALLPHGGAVREISPSHPFPPHNSHRPQAMAQSSAQAGIVPSSRAPSQFGGMGCSLSPCRMSAAGAPPHCLWLCLGGWTPRMEGAGRWVEPGHGCSGSMGWQRDVRVTWAGIVRAATRPAWEPAQHGEQLPLSSVPFGCCSRNVPSHSIDITEKALAWRGHGHHHLLLPSHHLQHQPGNAGGPGAAAVPSHLILRHFLITAVISSTAAPAQHVTSLQ